MSLELINISPLQGGSTAAVPHADMRDNKTRQLSVTDQTHPVADSSHAFLHVLTLSFVTP